jgi:glutathione S-transferase
MKFYDCATAPSPRRVRIFLAEKGIELPTVQVDLAKGEQLTPEFRAKNPRCTVPVLELNDGAILHETLAICYYLERTYPDPVLMGRDTLEQAQVLQWNSRIEVDGFQAVAEVLRNTVKGMKGRALTGPVSFEQIPELAERGRVRTGLFLRELNDHLADHRYLLGDTFTMADITGLVVVDFVDWIKLSIPDNHVHLKRWHEELSQRPSAKA